MDVQKENALDGRHWKEFFTNNVCERYLGEKGLDRLLTTASTLGGLNVKQATLILEILLCWVKESSRVPEISKDNHLNKTDFKASIPKE